MPMNTLAGLRASSEVDSTADFLDGSNPGSYGTMPKITRAFYFKTFLAIHEGKRVHAMFGQKATLPKGNGNAVMWRRYPALSVATTPITEGVTPSGVNLTYVNILGTVKQYGSWTGITDVVDFMHPDNILAMATKRLARQAADTEEVIIRDIINAGTSFLRCGADYTTGSGTPTTLLTARVNTAGSLHKKAIDTGVTMLESVDAEYFHGMMGASTKVGTDPIGPAYVAIIHPHVAHDLINAASGLGTDFVPREKYASGGVAYPSEVGKYRNVRFVTSTYAKVWPDSGAAGTSGATAASVFRATSATDTAADVYSCLILAKDAYGVVKLEGAAGTYYDKPGGQGDPLHQRSTAAWKRFMGAAILDDTNMVRIESLARW